MINQGSHSKAEKSHTKMVQAGHEITAMLLYKAIHSEKYVLPTSMVKRLFIGINVFILLK